MIKFNLILKYFPQGIRNKIEEYITKTNNRNQLEEIRLRSNRPIILKFNLKEEILDYIVRQEELLETLQYICENSIYAYQNQICNGYITVKGGHRVGICGNVVIEKQKVINITYISSLNFRIAKQIIGCGNKALKYIVDEDKNNIFNTIIISPPGVGKTTMLRDILRSVSNGIESMDLQGLTIGVVDERGEIAAIYKGVAQNDLGLRTDILDNIPKAIGMTMLIRSMGPNVISADEIGNYEDVEAINYAVCCGIKGIFTAHGSSLEDLSLNPALRNLLNMHIFERILILNSKEKGEIEKVYVLNKANSEYMLNNEVS